MNNSLGISFVRNEEQGKARLLVCSESLARTVVTLRDDFDGSHEEAEQFFAGYEERDCTWVFWSCFCRLQLQRVPDSVPCISCFFR